MKKIALGMFISVLISVVIYFIIAAALIIRGKPKKPTPEQGGLVFKELFVDYKSIPQLKPFAARDGKQLAYRYYPAQSDKVIILLHGSGWHSQYFLPLAKFISSEGLAQVYTPDLRGHGPTPERRGDVDYIGQLEDDLADFIAMIRRDNPNVDFNMPKEVRNGTETLSYTYRLNTSYAPHDYKKDLSAITQTLFVVVGSADEAFFADQFEPVISQFTKVRVKLLNGVTHMGAVVSPKVRPVVKEWLEGL